jgi:CheY-like chemotaxis protein
MITDYFHELSTLVVADSLPLKGLIFSVLRTLRVATVLTAGTGDEGFDLFCIHRPGLVIAEWKMKQTSGLDLTQKIRHNSLSPDRTVPVILTTEANAAMAQIIRARNAGVTGLVAMPVSTNELIKRITHAMTDRREFIDFPTYVGSDRRRKPLPGYSGPPRRAADRQIKSAIEETV